MADVPANTWHEIETDLGAVVMPPLAQAYAESAVALGNLVANSFQVDVGSAIAWTHANLQAAAWAKKYAGELVSGVTDTSQAQLQTAISNFFEKGQSLGDLRDQIGSIFGPERAAMIATTEITQAAVQGELETINSIEANSNLKMVATFHTDADEYVCPICTELDNQVVTEEDYPPVHPRCRCKLAWAPEGW